MLSTFLAYLGMSPSLAWFVFGFVLLILEVMNPSALIFFFGFGAWTVSVITPWWEISTSWQLMVFIITSLIYLALLRGTVLRYIESKMGEEPYPIEDEFVGKTAVVVERIAPPMTGKVTLNGTHWSARADRPLEVGEAVLVSGRDNLTLKVEGISS
jgi:membrane protein implicated in regulation of membrane protease activity